MWKSLVTLYSALNLVCIIHLSADVTYVLIAVRCDDGVSNMLCVVSPVQNSSLDVTIE